MSERLVVIAGSVPGGAGFLESFLRVLTSASMVKPLYKRFPDGETYVRIPVKGPGRAVIVQSIAPPQDSSLLTAMLLADAAKRAGFERVALAAPYMAYSRQDKVFLEGEPLSLDVVLRALYYSGVDEFYTLEIHRRGSEKMFPGKSYNITPFKDLAPLVKTRESTVVIAPDRGALERARELAEAVGLEYDYLEKQRDRVTGEILLEPKRLDVEGRHVILVDDIISTGGTIAKAAKMLRGQGARSVEVMVIHALMVGDALARLKESGVSRVYACNTLPPIKDEIMEYVDVGGLLAKAFKDLSGASVEGT